MHALLQRFLLGIAKAVIRWPRAIVVVSAVVTVLCVFVAASRFRVVNNISQLLDEDSQINRNYLQLKKEFGSDEVYLVLIQSENAQRNREAAARVGAFLQTLRPRVADVFWKTDLAAIKPRLLLLMPTAELEGIRSELAEFAGRLERGRVTANLNGMLEEANRSFDDAYLRERDNWKEFKPFIERFKGILTRLADVVETKPTLAAANADSFDLSGQDAQARIDEREYASFDSGRALLVVGVRGELEVDSLSPYTETVAAIRAKLEELRREFPDVRFGLTGEPVLNDDELQTSTRDTLWASLLTAAGIALLFRLSYRRLERPIWAGVVLGMGMAWTFAFAMATVGHFNIISFAIIPMALGLGIDFGVQLLSRYEEELHAGSFPDAAVRTALGTTGVAVLTGGTTTAAAFFTICFNEFLGLRELGWIAGASMVLCLAANLVTLPAILLWRDRRRARMTGVLPTEPPSNWEWLGSINDWILQRPRMALAGWAVVTVAAVAGCFLVRFDYNLLHLQNPKLESVRVLHEIFRVSENSTLFASVIAPDLEAARSLEQKLTALPQVARVESITSLLPTEEAQRERLVLVKKIRALAVRLEALSPAEGARVDPVRVRANLEQLLAQSREAAVEARKFAGIAQQARDAVTVFEGLIPPLERAVTTLRRLPSEVAAERLNQSQAAIFGALRRNLEWIAAQQSDRPIQMEDIPPDLRARFVAASGKVLLQVFAKGDLWERGPNAAFVEAVRTVAPDATGTPVQNYEYIELLRTSFLSAALWAFIAIVVLLALHFQTLRLIWLALFPLLLAVVWRTGLMGWIDLPFNPANVVTLPLIFGIDVAYGVYVVDRFREDGRIKILNTSTGKAIILTGLTSLMGFASLLVSTYRGMFSIGLLMSLGIVLGMLTTLIVLPQLLAARAGKSAADSNRAVL